MMDKNIMNGRPNGVNDPVGVGVGQPFARLETVRKPTLPDHFVKVTPTPENCIISWQECEGADRYRVDLYRIEDRGPNMRCFNYISVQSEWTEKCEFETIKLQPMTSYEAIVFAYDGDKFLGRYTPEYCVVAHVPVGDMPSDFVDEYTTEVSPFKDTKLHFSPLPAEKSVLLNLNPDRGFRSEILFFIPNEEELPNWTKEKIFEFVRDYYAESMMDEKVWVSRVYFILQAYSQTPTLPEAVIDYMDAVYEAHRMLGVRMYLCHFYTRANTDEHPAHETVMTHLSQVKDLFYKHRDLIYAVNFTFLGRYGEWTSLRVPLNIQEFVNTLMDSVPPEIRLIMRQPSNKAKYVNPEYWRYPRIGFADDACHGLDYPGLDIGQGLNQPGSVWWDMTVRESPYTINDTELFTTRWIRLSGTWPDGYSCMQSLSQKHTTTLSMEHGFSDVWRFGGELSQTCFAGWMSQEVTPELLVFYGLATSPSWFIDGEGKKIKRNAFEYLRDHVGYRLSAEELKISAGDDIALALSLKNYGYGAGFNLKSNFVLLDSEGNVVADCEAGNPDEWYGTDPTDYNSRDLLTHNINAKLSAPTKAGEYSVGLKLCNAFGQTARLDNAIEYKNGINILFKFAKEV